MVFSGPPLSNTVEQMFYIKAPSNPTEDRPLDKTRLVFNFVFYVTYDIGLMSYVIDVTNYPIFDVPFR